MKTVEPIPGELGRFFVQSRSRRGLKHVVDLAYIEEGKRKPRPVCSCEDCQCRDRVCGHIKQAVNYERKRLGL